MDNDLRMPPYRGRPRLLNHEQYPSEIMQSEANLEPHEYGTSEADQNEMTDYHSTDMSIHDSGR